jgi:tripartite-type tricarboxylate transporter receptor subunit TctC
VVELARDERGRNIMRLGASASEIGRSIMAPPGLAPERAAILRAAFEQVVKDKDFIAESSRRGLEVEPLSGDGILKIVDESLSMPVDVVDGLRAIMEPQK